MPIIRDNLPPMANVNCVIKLETASEFYALISGKISASIGPSGSFFAVIASWLFNAETNN